MTIVRKDFWLLGRGVKLGPIHLRVNKGDRVYGFTSRVLGL